MIIETHQTTVGAPANQTPSIDRSPVSTAALSQYLGLRYLPERDLAWVPGVAPTLPTLGSAHRTVDSSASIIAALKDLFPRRTSVGLLLSGGIDSAILAAVAPPGTPCVTISFNAPGAHDESSAAAVYAERWGHPHHVVRIDWYDYLAYSASLMAPKNAPLHPVEVPLYRAALYARTLGVDTLVVGNGADSTFGGMDQLLAKDWFFEAFVERYRFVDPDSVLAQPESIGHVFEPYRRELGIDVQGFLRTVHGQGIVQAFENAIHAAGVGVVAPYEELIHDGELDVDRIRRGEPKYLLQEVFRELYGTDDVPSKIAFARPMDAWLGEWSPAEIRPEFRRDLAEQLAPMTGEQRFLVWCLDQFLMHLDQRRHG